ncbi:MAG: ATP-binding cassette domain-containing protein [Actinophytocola sp.]|nr:ATP-binding cassette domain-containing protein [Actinophytocola sp.]
MTSSAARSSSSSTTCRCCCRCPNGCTRWTSARSSRTARRRRSPPTTTCSPVISAGRGGPTLLRIEGLNVSYGPVQVLFDVSLDVGEDEIVALLGTNGAGKTTVLRAVSGVIPVSSGTITFNGTDITGASPRKVVQSGLIQLPGGRGVFPGMSVRENLDVGAHALGARRKRAIEAVLDEFPDLGGRLDQQAGTMSGGQQQMLALAKSMVLEPKLLLIDELSLGLAPKVVEQLLETLRRYVERGVSVVVVEQHVDLALSIAERAYFMERGSIRFDGPSAELHGRDDLLRAVFLTSTGGR